MRKIKFFKRTSVDHYPSIYTEMSTGKCVLKLYHVNFYIVLVLWFIFAIPGELLSL